MINVFNDTIFKYYFLSIRQPVNFHLITRGCHPVESSFFARKNPSLCIYLKCPLDENSYLFFALILLQNKSLG